MSLASGNLTTLAAVQSYLSAPPTSVIINRLIAGVSRTILAELNRPSLVPQTYIERYRINRNVDSIVLFNWPVLSVTSVALTDFSPSSLYQGRLTFETWNNIPPGEQISLGLVDGFGWGLGTPTVTVTYRAGYQVTGEAQIIGGSPYHVTPAEPYGQWATDEGVTYTDGSVLTPIALGTPVHGQYLPPDPNASTPRLYYTFAAADTGLGVRLTYGYIPFEIEQLVLDMIAERVSYRGRIGLRSQSLASQETITYDLSGIPAYAKVMLRPYTNVLPPPIGVYT